jgi:stage III sporulation protein AD
LALTIKSRAPEISILLSLAAAALIFFMILPRLSAVFEILGDLSQKVDGDRGFVGILFKIIGVSYIAEFGAQICVDAGEGAIASKIELAGKALIMVISAPVILSLVEMVGG